MLKPHFVFALDVICVPQVQTKLPILLAGHETARVAILSCSLSNVYSLHTTHPIFKHTSAFVKKWKSTAALKTYFVHFVAIVFTRLRTRNEGAGTLVNLARDAVD